MEEFLKSILPWLLAGGGIGAYVGRFIEHRFALQREDRARAFEAKKEAYDRLSGMIYDFSYDVILVAKELIEEGKEKRNLQNM